MRPAARSGRNRSGDLVAIHVVDSPEKAPRRELAEALDELRRDLGERDRRGSASASSAGGWWCWDRDRRRPGGRGRHASRCSILDCGAAVGADAEPACRLEVAVRRGFAVLHLLGGDRAWKLAGEAGGVEREVDDLAIRPMSERQRPPAVERADDLDRAG